MARSVRSFFAVLFLTTALLAANVKVDTSLEVARRAYEASDYSKAVAVLLEAALKDPKDGEIQLMLAKSFLELQDYDAAIKSGEKAVGIDPQNSIYHEWLGKAYGEKADHISWPLSRMSLGKKAGKEFQTAVELDGKNYSARQALIEFDCSAPGMVGGGEEKAQPHIEELLAMDAAEGHYAAGNCKRQKNDFAIADEEFTKSLENQPKSANLIYDIGDYAMKRSQPERLLVVAEIGERVAPNDPRGKYYRAVGLVSKGEKLEEAERLLKEYAKTAPKRNGYPSLAWAHAWLGRLYEGKNDMENAQKEFENALQLDPKNKMAQEGMKRTKKR